MPNPPMTDEELARLFHDTYERLAPDYGYETRPETREFDPSSPNGKLMVAVAHEVNKHFHQRETALLEPLTAAFTDKGSHPDYHDEQMRHLETHWPSLYFAVRDLATIKKEVGGSDG